MRNYKQATVNVEEVRAQLQAKLDAKKAREDNIAAKAQFEKKSFGNVPSGRYVSSNVGGSDSYRPMKFNDEETAPANPAFAAAQTSAAPAPSAAPEEPVKKKKFFGLF